MTPLVYYDTRHDHLVIVRFSRGRFFTYSEAQEVVAKGVSKIGGRPRRAGLVYIGRY